MIEVEDLVFEYPTKRALFGVSCTVEKGSIAALVGPNGAGKTTLLRCVAALAQPFSGRIRVDGLDTVKNPREVHSRLGYLTDFYGLYEDLTVWQSLYFAARSRGLATSASEAAVAKTAERVHLTDRLQAKAGELSRGLRQRLAIGQAIVHEPAVLLLDEPASGLDPKARRDLSQLLLSLQKQGITQIVSSHILAELQDYASHMIIMEEGKVIGQRSITGPDGLPPLVVIEIELGEPKDTLVDWLRARDGLRVIEGSERGAQIECAADEKTRADLLQALTQAGFIVSGFSVKRQSLEDAYLDEIKSAQSGQQGGTKS